MEVRPCDGCQLSLLDYEDELLAVAGALDIANFPEASSAVVAGPTISRWSKVPSLRHTTPSASRKCAASRVLITIGACATAGGIQALRNFKDVAAFTRAVYATPAYISTLATSTPIAAHVAVDYELRGCPIDKRQLLEVVTAYLHRRTPRIKPESVCVECKRRGTVCVTVARGEVCLGPVTHAGCGALCPRYDRACFGCYGPKELANAAALSRWAEDELGTEPVRLQRLFHTFNAWAEPFRSAGEGHE